MGRTDFAGVIKQVCLEYAPEVKCGDYVLVHVGFALGKVDVEEAERTYKLLDEMNQLSELDTPEPMIEPFSVEAPAGGGPSRASPESASPP